MNKLELIAVLASLDELLDEKNFDGASRVVKRLLIAAEAEPRRGGAKAKYNDDDE